jgi:hypothetical protein
MDAEKEELWRKRMEHFEASGLSGTRWCEEQGISKGQFWYWKKRWEKSLVKEEESTWVPLVVADTNSDKTALTIRIGTAEIEVQSGYNATLLQSVVRTLMAIC